jgi:7-cyano-7-deazaguanine synthase in queuosine biosynthesis
MFFAMLATTYSPVVVIAGIKDDKVLDKSESAFLNMTQCMRVIDAQKVVVHSPFWSMTKRQVVAWYMENVGDKDKLLTTISCYSGTSRYCGKCASCFRKWCALFLNDIELEFHNRELALEYLSKAKSGVYVPERNQDIREAIWRYYGKR